MAWHGKARHGSADTARHGATWHGKARHGAADTARHGTAWHGEAQHGTRTQHPPSVARLGDL